MEFSNSIRSIQTPIVASISTAETTQIRAAQRQIKSAFIQSGKSVLKTFILLGALNWLSWGSTWVHEGAHFIACRVLFDDVNPSFRMCGRLFSDGVFMGGPAKILSNTGRHFSYPVARSIFSAAGPLADFCCAIGLTVMGSRLAKCPRWKDMAQKVNYFTLNHLYKIIFYASHNFEEINPERETEHDWQTISDRLNISRTCLLSIALLAVLPLTLPCLKSLANMRLQSQAQGEVGKGTVTWRDRAGNDYRFGHQYGPQVLQIIAAPLAAIASGIAAGIVFGRLPLQEFSSQLASYKFDLSLANSVMCGLSQIYDWGVMGKISFNVGIMAAFGAAILIKESLMHHRSERSLVGFPVEYAEQSIIGACIGASVGLATHVSQKIVLKTASYFGNRKVVRITIGALTAVQGMARFAYNQALTQSTTLTLKLCKIANY